MVWVTIDSKNFTLWICGKLVQGVTPCRDMNHMRKRDIVRGAMKYCIYIHGIFHILMNIAGIYPQFFKMNYWQIPRLSITFIICFLKN